MCYHVCKGMYKMPIYDVLIVRVRACIKCLYYVLDQLSMLLKVSIESRGAPLQGFVHSLMHVLNEQVVLIGQMFSCLVLLACKISRLKEERKLVWRCIVKSNRL